MNLCEFGVLKNGFLFCIRVDSICGHSRYCTNDRCIKMTNSYTKCKVRERREEEKKEDN
jgi:hypothetical protein